MADPLTPPKNEPQEATDAHARPQADALQKIEFDLQQIAPNGLVGPPDGRRFLDYEFCIPQQPAAIAAVKAINPNLQLFSGSRGRIGCTDTQYLLVGSTSSPEWKEQLLQLAALDYVQKIQQTFWE
jgi:hypothetical protein